MKEIIYGIFAEDDANKLFIEAAIHQLISYFGYNNRIQFIHEPDFTDAIVAKNGQYVKSNFIITIEIGITRFSLDLCVIGLDADDNDYEEYFQEMMTELREYRLEDKALIFIPVQAIEYWLWYIKIKKENPNLTTTDSVESSQSRTDLKKLIYGRKKPRTKLSNPIVKSLSQNIDLTWLRQCAKSFDHFCEHFEKFLEMIDNDK
ncbi:MAG: hypothetical protein AAF806_02110 [Bacteroidota bacterium]